MFLNTGTRKKRSVLTAEYYTLVKLNQRRVSWENKTEKQQQKQQQPELENDAQKGLPCVSSLKKRDILLVDSST